MLLPRAAWVLVGLPDSTISGLERSRQRPTKISRSVSKPAGFTLDAKKFVVGAKRVSR